MEQQALASRIPNCPFCQSAAKRFGHHRNGLQRFRCLRCGKTFTEEHAAPFRVVDYLRKPEGQRAIRMLTEGCSIRTVERLTGIRRDTIIELLLIAGERCQTLMDSLRNVRVTDLQLDECWNFVYCKEKNKTGVNEDNDEIGDCYNWVALDRPTKFVVAFVSGRRTLENAMELCRKIREVTTSHRVQITSLGGHFKTGQ